MKLSFYFALIVALPLSSLASISRDSEQSSESITRDSEQSSESTCPAMKRVYYSARFDWRAGSSSKKLRVRVGKIRGNLSAPARLVAVISSQRACHAQCEVRSIEPGNARSLTLNLICRSQAFGPLSSPATLFVTPAKAIPSQIRFGTWLQGYEQAPLRVEFDRSGELLRPASVSLASAP